MESKKGLERTLSGKAIDKEEKKCGTIRPDIKAFIAKSDTWAKKVRGRISFAEFCENSQKGGGSGMIQKGGDDTLKIDPPLVVEMLRSPNLNTPMPEGIRDFINGTENGLKTYLLLAKDGTHYLLARGYNVLQTFKKYVYVGVYITLNTKILNILYNGQCILWNNSSIFAPALLLGVEAVKEILGTVAAKVAASFASIMPKLVSLAGFTPEPMAIAAAACACLAAYLAYRFFYAVENTNLTRDQEREIEKFRVNALIEKFKGHAREIGVQEVKKSKYDKVIANKLVEIEQLLSIKPSPTAVILQKYSDLFKFVNEDPIQRLSIAYLYASYINKVLSKFPEKAVETTLGDLKQMFAIIFGVSTNDYPDLSQMDADARVQLFNLEFGNIIKDLMAVFVAVSGPMAAAGFVSKQLEIFGEAAKGTLDEIEKIFKNFLGFVQAVAAGTAILDENVNVVADPLAAAAPTDQPPAPPDHGNAGIKRAAPSTDSVDSPATKRPTPESNAGGSASRRRKSSRKPRNKRKTIRKKVSKTRNIRKITLNKKSKKRSKRLRK